MVADTNNQCRQMVSSILIGLIILIDCDIRQLHVKMVARTNNYYNRTDIAILVRVIN